MFGSLGIPELVIIMVIALIIFGPRKLPELGKALGQTIKEFKKGSAALMGQVEQEIHSERAPVEGRANASEPSHASHENGGTDRLDQVQVKAG